MSKLKKKNGDQEPFTMVPNDLLRSTKLDPYEKVIFALIASCGSAGFPSYAKLIEWSGMSREKLWKCLNKLESFNLIQRFKKGRKIHYQTWWDISSPNELVGAESVRYTNRISSPNELQSVRQANPIKNQDKESIKREISEIFNLWGKVGK